MADVTITNLTALPLLIQDLYTSVPANGSITVSRYAADLSRMASLQAAVAAGSAVVSVALTAAEAASGLAVPSATVEAQDMAPVAATVAIGTELEIRKSFTAAAAGAADDVAIFAAGALPYKMRVLDAYAMVSAVSAAGGQLLQIYDQAAGAGTLCAEMSSAATGRAGQTATVTATQVVTPGASVGLFVHRLNRDAAGEVVIKVRRES